MDNRPLIQDDEIFLRMNLAERLQHWVLISSFLLLILTGLPLFFYNVKLFKWLLPSGQSFYVRGVIHCDSKGECCRIFSHNVYGPQGKVLSWNDAMQVDER